MTTEIEKNKSSKERSVAYPSVTLGDAVDFTSKLREALGKGPYSRDEAARALGHVKLSGPAARKVAALVHYGLLVRSGNAYNQTQLAQDILKPLSDEQKTEAVIKAVRSPRLFEKLIQKYSGQALPTMLHHVLIREGISESAANEVSRLFTESIKFAGLLINGVVSNVPVSNEEDPSLQEGDPVQTQREHITSHTSQFNNIQKSTQTQTNVDVFIFEFAGGIKLIVPKSQKSSEGIADGGLKDARKALTDFASTYVVEKEDTSTEQD